MRNWKTWIAMFSLVLTPVIGWAAMGGAATRHANCGCDRGAPCPCDKPCPCHT